MNMVKTTSEGDVPLTEEEIAELLAERQSANLPKPKPKTLEERVAALEQTVASLK